MANYARIGAQHDVPFANAFREVNKVELAMCRIVAMMRQQWACKKKARKKEGRKSETRRVKLGASTAI